MNWAAVEESLNSACESGAIPGAVLVARRGRDVAYEGAFGHRTLMPKPEPMRIETVFDLSSLTKPLATALAAMMLVRDGKLKLDERVTRFFPNFGVYGKGTITFRHLMAHCSGLAAWRPFYKQVDEIGRSGKVNFMASNGAKQFVYETIHRERLESPTGSRTIYSDLNFILLGETVEQLSATTLDRFCRQHIFRALGLRSTDFIDLSLSRARRLEPVAGLFAATEICPSRKRLLAGEVHDENAYAMGGVAGHAGLFAPAREVDRIAAELLAAHAGRSDFVPRAIVAGFWRRDTAVAGSTWALGWDMPSPGGSAAGRHFSDEAVGHLGFTGTSIWIEPAKEIAITLLTNRVHPKRDNQAIRELRPRVHDLVMEALGAVN